MLRFLQLLLLSLTLLTGIGASRAHAIISYGVGGGFLGVGVGTLTLPPSIPNRDSTGTVLDFQQPYFAFQPTFTTDKNTTRIYSTPISFTTLAGTAGTTGSSDGVGTNASFNAPLAVAVDARENIYIADSSNNLIRKIDSNGVVTTLAGTPGIAGNSDGIGTNATFNDPEGVAVDMSGNVYVADTGNAEIRKIDSNGVLSTIAGHPHELSYFIQNWDADGTGTNAEFSEPVTVSLDAATNIYVADQASGNVRKITPDATVSTIATFGGGGYGPLDLVMDKKTTNLYVIDQWIQCIYKISHSGKVSKFAGKKGVIGDNDAMAVSSSFDNPQGITVDDLGNVYVSQRYNNIIRKISHEGNVTTIAGSIGVTGSSDGMGTNATFNAPGSMTVDHYGNLYVIDTGNNTIRKGIPVQDKLQTISFAEFPRKRFDSLAFKAKASVPSGLPIIFSSSNPNVAAISGSTISIAGAGTTTITASQNRYASFKAATPVVRQLVVEKASQTINLGKIPAQTLGTSPLTLPSTSSAGVTIAYTSSNLKVATISSNTVSIVGVGLSNITASAPATANYNASTVHQVLMVKKAN
jgi:DNA-binding beta-propeller fold protein YncE